MMAESVRPFPRRLIAPLPQSKQLRVFFSPTDATGIGLRPGHLCVTSYVGEKYSPQKNACVNASKIKIGPCAKFSTRQRIISH